MSAAEQEPIAVIGMSCRFPGGSNSPSKLWDLLKAPHDIAKPVPADRFDSAGFFHANGSHHGATDCNEAYFLDEDVTRFDNAFFNVQPGEAEALDPQQRFLMETIYDSLCSAGQTIEGLRGSRAAVYVGLMCDDWSQMNSRDWDLVPTYAATGTSRAVVSNRVSYFFDWHGPSMTIDTACSSSLVAVHEGVNALRRGECPVVVAAGANMILSPGMMIAESNLHMLSPTGRSKMWDASADGYARGEGIAAVVLKPLSAALRDGDPINCVIRGTGVNQDGRTPGLTMPNNVAQTDLIRDTYERAGLNLQDPKDRPQFFHAHGTGTPAGDPQEAEAISRAFYDGGSPKDPLFVGSIKTVIGHTEGTAGLASLIGTCLAMQHNTIPPNLHFNSLSSRVAEFCSNLRVPTKALTWPTPVAGQPRRASVNSFGFGGTNAHAIIESYEAAPVEKRTVSTTVPAFTPLTVSAASASALRTTLSELSDFVQTHPDIDLRDLAYTLQHRRSTLAFRKSIAVENLEGVVATIGALLSEGGAGDGGLTSRYFDSQDPKILGVFTGQGAQWPRMGALLLEQSPYVSELLTQLDQALATLPEGDRPDWTLRGQILAEAAQSRLSEAAISQPLCTAVQIVLVDLLTQAGIKLSGVVGHSSGEIAAAYAAGFLSATDAIRVAYYRGLYAKLAGSPAGRGSMLAVGTSFEDALEFCELEEFEGRIKVAARNSSNSVTLSGDEDAIEEALEIYKDEGRFARQLRVDTAYHSHHMEPCAVPYLDALARCEIKVGEGNGIPWYSSVVENHVMSTADVQPQYWVDNMTSAVLFSPAVAHAVAEGGQFDLGLEVGPHPALKGPCLDTVEEAAGHRIPYTGLLGRNKNDVLELSSALGFIWTQLGAGSVDFDRLERAISGGPYPKKVVADLPTYPFDHSRSFYTLTRFSGAHRNMHAPPNPILGRRCVESETADEVSWRNILKSGEISWLQGHQLQGQTVFPAMGYIAMCVEAAAVLAGPERPLGLVTLEDVIIGRALAFQNESVGMESKVTVKIDYTSDDELRGHIACHSGLPFDSAAPLALNFSANIHVHFHEPRADTLPAVRADEISLVKTDPGRLYSQFTQLGYNYSPPFTGVKAIDRKRGFATGEIEDISGEGWEDQLIVHPGWLDSALQTAFAAYSYPHDNRLWALHVPTEIRTVSINPYFTARGPGGRTRQLQYQSTAREGLGAPVAADIDVFAAGEGEGHAFVQLEAVQVKPFAAASARDDAILFARFDYRLAGPDAIAAVEGDDLLPPKTEAVVETIERVGFYYLRRVHETITPAEREATLPHFRHLIDLTGRVVPLVAAGEHPHVPREAINDSASYIRSLIARYHDRADIQLLEAVGENLVSEIRRNGIMLEHMMKDGILDRFYEELAGLDVANVWIARMVAQVAHRHPHLRILEIGAGTGGTTRTVLPMLGDAFQSYTFTDISAGFFERAQERFRTYADRMVFATYNMELTPEEQGFEEGSYDVVLASNVLHATGRLDDMMANTRRLLRPGGYLMMLEFVSNDRTGITACMGGLPGWWGNGIVDPARGDGPCLTPKQWDELVRRHGFGGVDTHCPVEKHLQWYTVHLCQAVDDRVLALRDPLASLEPAATLAPPPAELVIVGGTTAAVTKLVDETSALLASRYSTITRVATLEELHERGLALGSSVLSLTELDKQFFEERTEAKLEALKGLWRAGGSIVWATRGVRDAAPYSAMILGLARVVRFEYPNINLQILDFDEAPTAAALAADLVRLEMGRHWKEEGANLLWSVEPEAHYENGQLFIPRMYPDRDANARYNTQRRTVAREVDPRETSVVLEPAGPAGDALELCAPSPLRVAASPRPGAEKTVEILVEQSVLHAVKVPGAGFFSLCSGTNAETGRPLLALVDSPVESRLHVPVEWTVQLREPLSRTGTFSLGDVASHLVARAILSDAPGFGSLLVHEADELLKEAFGRESAGHGANVVFTTADKMKAKANAGWVLVHEKLPGRLVQKLLPHDISAFADLSNSEASASAQLLARCLPAYTPVATAQDVIRAQAGASPDAAPQDVGAALKAAWQAASRKRKVSRAQSQTNTSTVLALQDVGRNDARHAPLSVVDWNAASVSVALRPIDAGTIFRADGTYFLVGLSGEVGQSLCGWMVAHGARHIVLSSRRPKVHPRYIEELAALGATVRVMALDVTKREALRECYDTIRAEMPPIIGVANGALLLEDALFDMVQFETLQRTAPPKVEGSALLDELFYDTPLDFFILFTSVANITGNTGQSAYVIANQFMTALAAQRRDIRGVPGSTIAISSVQGLGYLEHSDIDKDRLVRWGYRNISEQDLHLLFAEAVLAGRPGAPGIAEVVTSMSPFRDSVEIQPNLRFDPKFRHYILQQAEDGAGGNKGGAGGAGGKTVRPRARLANVTSQAEVFDVVQDSLTENLKRILMMPATESVDPMMSLVELGIDSIMAVDLRTWFLKELDVDVPVLKILSPGETVKSLAEEAMAKIPADIVDLTKLAEGAPNGGSAPAAAAQPTPVAPVPVTKKVIDEQASELGGASVTTPSTRAETTASSPALVSTPGTSLERPDQEEDKQLFQPPPRPQAAAGTKEDADSWRKAIARASTEHVEHMTFGQRRFWFLSHYVDEPTTFNIAYLGKLTGRLRVNDLAKAVEKAAQRHETLRTRFFWSSDDTRSPMQGILSQTLVRLETATIETEAQASEELEAMRKYEWNLGDWVPLRMRLLSLSETSHYLILGSHHISMDGHSFSVFLLDIHQAYNNPARPLPPMPATSQARAFGQSQIAAYESGQLRPAIEHYRKVLPAADLARPIELFPFARTKVRPPLDRYGTHVARAHLGADTTAKLKALARGRRATSFHAYLGTLQALLFRLLPTDTTERVYIGIADANRLDSRFATSVGNFLNVLPLRFDRTSGGGGATFGQAIETARDKARDALKHSALPFDLLLDEVGVPRSNAWAPVFQVFMNYRLVVKEHADKQWVGCRIGEERWHTARTGYDVALEIVEDHDGATLAMHVQQSLYDADAAELLVRSFANAVKEFAAKGDAMETNQLQKWDKQDVEKALEIGTAPALNLEWPATVAHRIDEVIAQNPTAVALKDGLGNVLTYAQMDARVESIANALHVRLPLTVDNKPPVVGVFQAPSADWICSLVAIHRIGAVYLPLDLRNSIPRLKSNVAVARPAAILVDAETTSRTAELEVKDAVPAIDVSRLAASTAGRRATDTAAAKADQAAYIIFTSGSTGEPKGIVVTHAGLRNNLEGYHRAWNIPSLAGVVLQQASFGFDASLLQVYAALTTGGCLLVVPADARGDPAEVTRLMVDHGVTMTQATPSEYEMWLRFAPDQLRRCTSWKAAWFGGERAAPGLVRSFRDLCVELPNLAVYTSYGPTESTISAMKGVADVRNNPNLTVPVPGRLLPNYTAYLVDDEMRPLPIGVPGEILLGGAGVGKNEYLGRPDLTVEAFISSPFTVPGDGGSPARLYRTGDYGRLDKSGFLAIEGRIAGDTQVKLRGFRIELAEIERVMLRESDGQLAQVVVTARGVDDGQEDGFLAAHVVLDNQDTTTADTAKVLDKLRARLPLSLPQYMCPAVIVPLPEVPLTSNSKVDRRAVQALPLPETTTTTTTTTTTNDGTQPLQPLTPTETQLAALWTSVLPQRGLAAGGALQPRTDFFAAGGNSLLLVKLQAAVKREFGDAPRLSKLMSATELGSMAALLEQTGAGALDWGKETALDLSRPSEVPVKVRENGAGLRVLVTGASGSLGKRIVRRLAGDGRVAAVVCLVRPAEGRDPANLFFAQGQAENAKVRVVTADLPTIPTDHPDLAINNIDAVVHCAADRSFWDGYNAVKPVNVDALKTLASLSLRAGARLHALSSGALAAFQDPSDESAQATLPRPSPADGYMASKWVAERYLARAAREAGLRVTAHRPSEAVPASQKESADVLAAMAGDMLRLSASLGVRPDYARLSGSFDVGRIEDVAAAVAGEVTADVGQSGKAEAMHTVSYPGMARVQITELAAYAESLLAAGGADADVVRGLPTVPALHWVGLAKRAGLFEWLLTAQHLVVDDEEGRKIVSRR
ncbi:BcPKS5, polyketide synthase [Chaetomium fimeti]|uniref:BcPKS5, polyketide synthase n=1 Tax=Chaetomium fimeti TaxID=1854472 RepID=A0AAE0HMX4_9PEZI|nr:BcPKS5, polyketide synthase [Chaetomium fimeti]